MIFGCFSGPFSETLVIVGHGFSTTQNESAGFDYLGYFPGPFSETLVVVGVYMAAFI